MKLFDNNFLILLYKTLFKKRQDFLLELQIKDPTNNLSDNLRSILKVASNDIFKDTTFNVPIDFLNELYAITVLTAIV